MLEVLDFLTDLRDGIGPKRKLAVALLEGDAADHEAWQRKLFTLGGSGVRGDSLNLVWLIDHHGPASPATGRLATRIFLSCSSGALAITRVSLPNEPMPAGTFSILKSIWTSLNALGSMRADRRAFRGSLRGPAKVWAGLSPAPRSV